MPRKLTHSAAIDPPQPLQPCPFCGGSEAWINSDLVPKFVACRKCWASGPSAPTVTQAAERWNKRAAPPGMKTAAATCGMTDIAQLNQGRFYWVLIRSSTKDPEWQPARFAGVSGHGAGAKWHLIGLNTDVGHYFFEVTDIGTELTALGGSE